MSCCKADCCPFCCLLVCRHDQNSWLKCRCRTSSLPTSCKVVNMSMQCCCSFVTSVASTCIHAKGLPRCACNKDVLSHTCRLPRGSRKCSSGTARPRAELRLPGSLSGCACGPEQSVVHVHSQCAGYYTWTPQRQNGGMGFTLQPCHMASFIHLVSFVTFRVRIGVLALQFCYLHALQILQFVSCVWCTTLSLSF